MESKAGRKLGPDPIDVAVGARIRLRRVELGLSQTAVAEAIGITFQQVQKYERGTNRVSASKLTKIAAVLTTSVSHLVGEGEAAPVAATVLAELATPGAVELVAAFASLEEAETREALMALAKGLARSRRRAARERRARGSEPG
jgi:transcriptional regulator with XRE-family HTH domain